MILRSYQEGGVKWLLKSRVRGLAFDAGLGKTDTALHAAASLAQPIVILCPASLRSWWHAKLSDYSLEGRVLSYHEAALHGVEARGCTLICDEAQALKNPFSKRHKAARKAAGHASHTWFLSATPAPHSPADYYGHLVFDRALQPLPLWIRQYCHVIAGQYGDKIAGFRPGGKDALRKAVESLWLFRSWAECVADVPPLSFSYIPLGDAESLGIIRAIQKEMPDILENIEALQENEANLTRVRHLIGLEKVRATGPYLRDKLEGDWAGERIVVYGEFLDSLNALHAAAGGLRPCLHYRGDMPDRKKALAVEAWKERPGSVLFVQIRAGGTGLNLPEARIALIAEGTWTPADWWQAASRLRRMDQPHPVLVECPFIAGTLDESIVRAVGRRAEMVGISL